MHAHNLSAVRRAVFPQPAVAGATVAVAVAAASLSGIVQGVAVPGNTWKGLLLAVLFGAVILAEQFPVHVRINTKVQMTTVPIFVMAVLLPPSTAAILAGLSMLVGEISVNHLKCNYPSDIATDCGRWGLAAFLGSQAALLGSHAFGFAGGLVAAGAVMWVWDMVSSPATLSPMSGETPRRVIVDMIREAGPAELAQYVLGIMATVMVLQAPWAVPLLALPAATVQIATKRSKELHRGTQAMLERMADTVDLRDPYTGGHSRRVTELVEGILKELRKSGPDVDLIITAARLHDIGKIAVPDAILNKPGKLSEDEWDIMASHSEVGADFLGKHPGFKRGVEIVRHHHEAWDGTGYPHRLSGTAIPLGARVIAVADSYDAMTSDRPYRKGMTTTKALGILREGRGRQWDPELVDAFVRSMVESESSDVPRLRLIHTDGAPMSQTA